MGNTLKGARNLKVDAFKTVSNIFISSSEEVFEEDSLSGCVLGDVSGVTVEVVDINPGAVGVKGVAWVFPVEVVAVDVKGVAVVFPVEGFIFDGRSLDKHLSYVGSDLEDCFVIILLLPLSRILNERFSYIASDPIPGIGNLDDGSYVV